MRFSLFVLAALVGLLHPAVGRALPPPFSAEKLAEESDVIATVRVLAVTCTGEITQQGTGEKLPTYQAWLQVLKATKGPARVHDTLLVSWHDISKKLIGPWTVAYYPGEEVTTHLKWNAEQRTYTTTWWNAKGEALKPADTTALPRKSGTVVTARGLSAPPVKE